MEGPWGGIALAAVIAAPGVLVLLALHDRPALLLPAGVILVPLSFLSFAGVLLPLLVVAVVLFVAYGRRSAGRRRPQWRTTLTTVVVVALLVAAAISAVRPRGPAELLDADREWVDERRDHAPRGAHRARAGQRGDGVRLVRDRIRVRETDRIGPVRSL